jgi:hypothetical protein
MAAGAARLAAWAVEDCTGQALDWAGLAGGGAVVSFVWALRLFPARFAVLLILPNRVARTAGRRGDDRFGPLEVCTLFSLLLSGCVLGSSSILHAEDRLPTRRSPSANSADR